MGDALEAKRVQRCGPEKQRHLTGPRGAGGGMSARLLLNHPKPRWAQIPPAGESDQQPGGLQPPVNHPLVFSGCFLKSRLSHTNWNVSQKKHAGGRLELSCLSRVQAGRAGGVSEPAGDDSEFPDGAAGPITREPIGFKWSRLISARRFLLVGQD